VFWLQKNTNLSDFCGWIYKKRTGLGAEGEEKARYPQPCRMLKNHYIKKLSKNILLFARVCSLAVLSPSQQVSGENYSLYKNLTKKTFLIEYSRHLKDNRTFVSCQVLY